MNTSKYSSAEKVLNTLGVSQINFGKLLKNHRLGEELTWAQMSKVLKISISHLSDIENESAKKVPPTFSTNERC